MICLTLLAIGWGTSMSARQSEVWWDVDRTPSVALVQVQVGTAAGSQRIQIQMPKRVQQRFAAHFVEASGRRIPIQGSLAGCREATGAEQKDTIELDSFSWGEPTATMGHAEFVVEIDASGPSSCRIKLIVPAHLLDGGAGAGGSRLAAPGSDPHQAAPRRVGGNESAPARQQGNPTVPLHRPLGFKARSAETSVHVAQKARAAQAYVPMRHEGCAGAIDCTTHGLVSRMGNLTFAADLTVSCADGQQVTGVRYALADGPYIAPLSQQLVNAPTGSPVYRHELGLAPYSPQDFEEICREELGGDWADQTAHPDVDREEKALLIATLRVWGRCTGDAADTLADTTTKVQVTCVDTDHP
jgi:hypothetical protein